MEKKKVLVTGGSGLVGSAIKSVISKYREPSASEKTFAEVLLGYEFIYISSKDVDLTDYASTHRYIQNLKPQVIIHLAANVGGLYKNMNYKVDMFEKNTMINYNVLKAAHSANVKKVVSCLSTCIFPDKTTYPINETMLHDGPPHYSNDAYAYAKRSLEIHSKAYQEQYNRDYICIIPTNIYGPEDNFHLEDGHVIPCLVHKCYLAKKQNRLFEPLGTGKPLRQFIYSEDLAKLILWTVLEYKGKSPIILSPSEREEVSIKDVAENIAKSFNYLDNIKFNPLYSDGQYKKTADNSKLKSLITKSSYKEFKEFQFTDIETGIKKTVQWFIENYDKCRK